MELTKEKRRQNCHLPYFSAFSGGWLEGGCLEAGRRRGAFEQSNSWMGFVSNPCLPQKASFSYPPSPVASHNNCLVCLQKKKKTLQIETLADSRKQGLRWHGRVFVYLQALCFYCCCNQRSRALYWKLISGNTCILK